MITLQKELKSLYIGKGNEMKTVQTATRYHDFSYGHRVHNHECKCAHLHGHNGRVHFEVSAPQLDAVGRVLDFSDINRLLCQWVEENWDHKFLAYKEDPIMQAISSKEVFNQLKDKESRELLESIVWLDFNPTAENMAEYLLKVIAPAQLQGTGIVATKVVIEETRKCSVTAMIG